MILKVLMKWYSAITKHYAMHTPAPVGMFAASYLERRDWEHH